MKLSKCTRTGVVIVTLGCIMCASLGCTMIEPVMPDNVMKTPFGTESVKVGMSRAQVESLWGKPGYITTAEDKAKWTGTREVWVYRAEQGSIPVDAGNFSKTRKLYFDGNNLTNIE